MNSTRLVLLLCKHSITLDRWQLFSLSKYIGLVYQKNHLLLTDTCLKLSKCSFMSVSVEYLGHHTDGQGLHPTHDKVQVVKDALLPTDVTKLKSFLGLINYYRKFLPDLSSVLAPLNELL